MNILTHGLFGILLSLSFKTDTKIKYKAILLVTVFSSIFSELDILFTWQELFI